jgi:glyoxylase-like metal-dependent hydrolase (beta-lactamase superfamily II)
MSKANFICTTCGTQYAESEQPLVSCVICEDERQYVKASGQQWTTHDKLRLINRNSIRFEEAGLIGIGVEPHFAIGQRAMLVRTPAGNILWDCVPLLDPAVIEMVTAIGGISAIAISHPHYYSSMVEWGRTFDCPVLVHEADREWVMRPDACIEYWSGETYDLCRGMTLVRCGGHFAGSAVLHVAAAADGRGALLVGDTLMVLPGGRRVSFMRSYPMLLPLPERYLDRLLAALDDRAYDRLHGAWTGSVVPEDAQRVVRDSAALYRGWLTGTAVDPDQD